MKRSSASIQPHANYNTHIINHPHYKPCSMNRLISRLFLHFLSTFPVVFDVTLLNKVQFAYFWISKHPLSPELGEFGNNNIRAVRVCVCLCVYVRLMAWITVFFVGASRQFVRWYNHCEEFSLSCISIPWLDDTRLRWKLYTLVHKRTYKQCIR